MTAALVALDQAAWRLLLRVVRYPKRYKYRGRH